MKMYTDDLDPYSPMDLQQILSSEIDKVQTEMDKVKLENKKLRYILSLPIVPAIVRNELEKV